MNTEHTEDLKQDESAPEVEVTNDEVTNDTDINSESENTVADDMAKHVEDDAVDVDASDDDAEVTAEDLDDELEAAKVQVADYMSRLQHLQADFQNYKKRKEKEQGEVFTMIEDRLIGEFLPLFDDLNRAFEVYEQDSKQDNLIDGVERIFAKFKDFLESKSVQPVEALGQKFDPNLHEVLLSVESDQEPNTILDEYERGYIREGRLLRASRVTVSKRPDPVNIETIDSDQSAESDNDNEDEKE
jgi:molecular chaperone GrpE